VHRQPFRLSSETAVSTDHGPKSGSSGFIFYGRIKMVYPHRTLSLILSDGGAEDWFSNSEKLKRVHNCVAEVRKLGERVKVAILDSGIDSRHSEMAQNIFQPCPVNCTTETEADIKSRDDHRAIKSWRGFPSTLDPCQDRLGHGTHIASVILKTSPYVALYIARIFSDDGQMCELHELAKVQI